MKYSNKFIKKFLSSTLEDISERPWYKTLTWYVIDSKERTRKRLDSFLKDQLTSPDLELMKVAEQFKYPNYLNSDEAIIAILEFVYKNVRYGHDRTNFGKVEYWANAAETWKKKRDDCDGINALIYILARLSGITDLLIWCAIGDVNLKGKKTGHFWLMYFSPKTGKWYTIDGTYYPDFTEIKERELFKFKPEEYIDSWFIFNESNIYKK